MDLWTEAPSQWLLRAGGREWEDVGPGAGVFSSWSPDARSIVALDPTRNRVQRLTLATRRIELVAELGENPLVSPFGAPWMGLAHDASPLVTEDRSTRDLYAFDWEAP